MAFQAVEQFLFPVLMSELLTDLLTSLLLQEYSRDVDVAVCESEEGADFKP